MSLSMLTPDAIVELSRRYAAAHDIPISTVSSRLFDDGKKIAALENGADINLGRFNKALHWFSDNWPKSAEWPQEIPRPEFASAETAQ